MSIVQKIKENWLLALLLILVVFYSAFLFVGQFLNHSHRIAGKIISVSPTAITLENARHQQTVLIINNDTIMADHSLELRVDLFIRATGKRIDEHSFQAERVNVLHKP